METNKTILFILHRLARLKTLNKYNKNKKIYYKEQQMDIHTYKGLRKEHMEPVEGLWNGTKGYRIVEDNED